ncbi:endonuclease [candidate division TA06 bacterium]|nr:endonuclease [candidate division TA06 bacterium]
MKKHFKILIFLGLLLQAGNSLAVVLYPGVTGRALIDSLRKYYKTVTVQTYDTARDKMYGEIDIQSGSLTCVYSGWTITGGPTADPTAWATAGDINCEHTWPQSLLDSTKTESDMHHLFPTKMLVNADRGNSPFAEIPDASTQYWYYQSLERGTSIPSSNIDAYAEVILNISCEPREVQQGNTARAMFYVLTMYQLGDTSDAWWTGQKYDLRDWHAGDPSDSTEKSRTWKIAAYQQNKPNPFVIDSSLVDRCYFPEYLNTSVYFASSSITKTEGDAPFNLSVSIATPSATNTTSVQVVLTSGTAADINNYTTQTLNFPAGSSASQNASITITDDALAEGTETLTFKLRNVSGGTSAAIGADSVFTLTLGDNDDVTAPVITSGPSVTGITSSSATVNWTTDEASNSWVYYGLTTAYSDTAKNESDVTGHSVGLSGLTTSTTYHYKVSSVDPMNNGPAFSGDNTFTTTAAAGGTTFLFEPFDYPAGDSINGVHNWILHSGTTSPIRVVSPGLTYGGYKSKAVTNACSLTTTGEDANRAFSVQSSGTVYASFLVKVDSATLAGDYFFHLSTSPINTSYFVGRIYARKDASNNLAFGLAKASEGATYSSYSYTLKIVYVLVLKYKIGAGAADDSMSLFVINGTLPSSEPATATVGPLGAVSADPAAIGTVALRQGGSTTGPVLKLDDIKIGSSWGSAPLDIQLTSFTSMCEPGMIVLRWATASELNCYQWQIERSRNASSGYQVLSSIPASGNVSGQSNYCWTDHGIEPGQIYYYRLKALGLDGITAVYGPVTASAARVISERADLPTVNCSPNPFARTATFSYLLNRPGMVDLNIYNVSGHLVKSINSGFKPAGRHYLVWNGLKDNGQACASGIYFYRLTCGEETYHGKLILAK